MTATTCLHCGGDCRLTDGAEIYPHRPDLHHKPIWKCDPCQATVGCHPGGTKPLGYAADKKTRDARMQLHNLMLDPLWLDEQDRKDARRRTYRFLARALGIGRDECHTGMFTIDRCRDAWRALKDQTPETIRAWNASRCNAAQEARTDRKSRKRGKRGRRASRDDVRPITGPLFCPRQAALNEVPW
ncbi:MAG: DUF3268 family zinc-finger domain-containing protein [Alphaproteobacteria bacterium]|nr:DUF3268 family zinc-finger domain-containing protein [Alphaproteobacteria bacterium]